MGCASSKQPACGAPCTTDHLMELASSGSLKELTQVLTSQPQRLEEKVHSCQEWSLVGETLLHRAARYNQMDVARMLLGKGIKVSEANSDGATSLHYACYPTGSREMAELLIRSGAELNSRTRNGYTPLDWACWYGRMDVCLLLIERGGKMSSQTLKEFGKWANPRPTNEESQLAQNFLHEAIIKIYPPTG